MESNFKRILSDDGNSSFLDCIYNLLPVGSKSLQFQRLKMKTCFAARSAWGAAILVGWVTMHLALPNYWPVCSLILRKISNRCHQMLDFKAKMHQVRFPLGLPDPLRELATVLKTPKLYLRGLLLKEGERDGGRREGKDK